MKRLIIRGAVAVAVLAAAWWLWSWSGDEEHGRGLAGGPLFDVGPADVASLEIRRPSGVTVIARQHDRWRATGLVDDLIDADRFEPTLGDLLAGVGQPVIAGTEPDERRYGFGGDGSLELVFHLTRGGRRRLARGDLPVQIFEELKIGLGRLANDGGPAALQADLKLAGGAGEQGHRQVVHGGSWVEGLSQGSAASWARAWRRAEVSIWRTTGCSSRTAASARAVTASGLARSTSAPPAAMRIAGDGSFRRSMTACSARSSST